MDCATSDTGKGETMLDVDAVLQVTRGLDPTGTREAVTRYVQEIEEMSQLLDTMELPSTWESIQFSAAWPAANAIAESE
jgi:hypothetical protein